MAPATGGSLEISTTTTAADKGSTQRSISSFFGAKSGPISSTKPRATSSSGVDKKSSTTKKTLNIPALEPDKALPQPTRPKRARVGNDSVDDDLGSPALSPDPKTTSSTSSDWLSTPSPSEPSRSVTKCFGRRDRNALKAGVMAPVVKAPAETKSRDAKTTCKPESLIGKRLKVFWPLDKVWYAGEVASYSQKFNTHVIRYDDGEDESVVLEKEKVKWLDNADAPFDGAIIAKLPEKRSRGRLNRSNSPPPPPPKRKKAENSDSLLDELKDDEGEEVRSETPIKEKKTRLDQVQEDDCTPKVMTVTTEFFDEVDIDVADKEEDVKVLRRLRKKAGKAAPRKKDDVETVELLHLEEPTKGVRRVATSARRLQLEDSVDCDEKPSMDVRTDSPEKTSSLLRRNAAGVNISLSTKNSLDSPGKASSPASGDSKISPSTRNSSEPKVKKSGGKVPPTCKISQAKDFFSRVGIKSSKRAAAALPVLASAKCDSPPSKEPPAFCMKPAIPSKDAEAEKFAGGELHSNLAGEAAERFGGRVNERFKFLGKGRRDASGKRPSDPDFDPRTVLLPADFLKQLSGGQRQWWEFKSKHMDKVLLFKMGKFYEMFEMDAHVGAQDLDLQYMKGEQPHCGFPEKLYSVNAEKLARKGYRVLVVEQTETPDQLEQRKKETGTKDKVVRREVCAVLTKGTIVDGEMLGACPDAAYLMSITEFPSSPSVLSATPEKVTTVGMCFVDTSTSHIMLGQFVDDSTRSRLRSVLSELRPVELIKPHGLLAEATERAIKDHTRQPLINSLVPGKEFWDAKKSLKEILAVYTSFKEPPSKSRKSGLPKSHPEEMQMLPVSLRQVMSAGSTGEAAISAFGGSLFYLREALLDRSILRMGRVDVLPGSDPFTTSDPFGSADQIVVENSDLSGSADQIAVGNLEPHMILDSAALENLEILENSRDGGVSGTLLAFLDNCVTPYGRRLLRQWLVRPLLRVESILQRQQSVLDLRSIAAEAAISFRKELGGQPDMERLLARMHACSGGSGRNAKNVVLYEDAAKKQLQEFIHALRGCRALLQAVKSFKSCLPKLTSSRFMQLVTPGIASPDMTPIIEEFEASFDCEEAEKTGRIVPHDGVDKDFDEADSAVRSTSKKLDEYLISQRKKFGNSSEITYVTVGKEAYQMEIPDEFHSEVPSSYQVVSSRKGFRRYWTPEIKELVQDKTAGEQQRELALKGILQGLVKRFCGDYSKWLALVKSVAEIDVLISLAETSLLSGPTCRPTFVRKKSSSEGSSFPQKISAEGIRHPTVSAHLPGGGTFVPNDISLGGTSAPFMLLTGPNMGGKSTLIRQVCLAVVLAQVGANVTADKFELSPVDRVFVRMGAKDHIMAGQSTFLVELSETASMLRSATSNSLVALDELGRGTSTSDGQAIAHSVLQYLAHNVGCRGMFSTHYHRLAMHFSLDPKVGLFHMSCKVGTGVGGLEEVIFLYKLSSGACPKSYGVNVARLAGMPEAVLQRATKCSEELEIVHGKTAAGKSVEESKDAIGSSSNEGRSTTELAKEAISSFMINESDGGLDSLLLVWEKVKRMLGPSLPGEVQSESS